MTVEPLAVLVFIAALAAALKSAEYLWRKGQEIGAVLVVWVEEKKRVRHVLSELTAEEGWPNGADSLTAAHRDLYERVAGVDRKVDELTRTVEVVALIIANRAGEPPVGER